MRIVLDSSVLIDVRRVDGRTERRSWLIWCAPDIDDDGADAPMAGKWKNLWSKRGQNTDSFRVDDCCNCNGKHLPFVRGQSQEFSNAGSAPLPSALNAF